MRLALALVAAALWVLPAAAQTANPDPATPAAPAPAATPARGEFGKPFGPLTVTTSADGSFTLARTKADADAGADWVVGKEHTPLDADHACIRIVPLEALNGGYYVATLIFFNDRRGYLGEVPLVPDTNKLTPAGCADVRTLAAAQPYGQEIAALMVRIRVHPVTSATAAFRFARIEIGPVAPPPAAPTP